MPFRYSFVFHSGARGVLHGRAFFLKVSKESMRGSARLSIGRLICPLLADFPGSYKAIMSSLKVGIQGNHLRGVVRYLPVCAILANTFPLSYISFISAFPHFS